MPKSKRIERKFFSEIVHKKLYRTLMNILEQSPSTQMRWNFVDSNLDPADQGIHAVPVRITQMRVRQICTDHSLKTVQIWLDEYGEWGTIYPEEKTLNNGITN